MLRGVVVGESAQCFPQREEVLFHSIPTPHSIFTLNWPAIPLLTELSFSYLPSLHFLMVMILCIFQYLLQIAWAPFPMQYDFFPGTPFESLFNTWPCDALGGTFVMGWCFYLCSFLELCRIPAHLGPRCLLSWIKLNIFCDNELFW